MGLGSSTSMGKHSLDTSAIAPGWSRRKVLGVCIAAAAVVLSVVIWLGASLAAGVAPTALPILFADAVGITNNNAEAHATIEGTTTFQAPYASEGTWEAGSATQRFTIANPKGNTVNMAGHIYVDLDGDSTFQEDECVYNPVRYDEEGNVSSYGTFVAPGMQTQVIDLVRGIPAGSYDALLAFTALDVNTDELCTGQAFEFHIDAV